MKPKRLKNRQAKRWLFYGTLIGLVILGEGWGWQKYPVWQARFKPPMIGPDQAVGAAHYYGYGVWGDTLLIWILIFWPAFVYLIGTQANDRLKRGKA